MADEETDTAPPTRGRLLLRGLLKHCPRCGQGHLFRRWFSMAPTCPRCGLDFNREPGWVLGAMTINTAFMFVVAIPTMLAGFVITYPDVKPGLISIVSVLAAGAAALIGYPFSKTVWIAIDLMMVPDGLTEGDVRQGSSGAGPTRSSSRST